MTAWVVDHPMPEVAFPLGPRVTVTVGIPFEVTVVAEPVLYVIVGADPANALLLERQLEEVRVRVARALGTEPSAAVPKLAVLGPAPQPAELRYRTRMAHGMAWHPGMAASGLLALGVSLGDPASVGGQLVGPFVVPVLVDTWAGPRWVEPVRCPDGRPGVRVRIGAVHVLDPSLEEGP